MRLTIQLFLFVLMMPLSMVLGQANADLVDSTFIVKLDTSDFISQSFDLGRKGRETLEFAFEKPDTVVYILNKESRGRVFLQLESPKGLYEYDSLISTGEQVGFFAADTSGSYLFKVKNKSLRKAVVKLDLKTVRSKGFWEVKVNKIGKKRPDRIKYDTTIVRDTVNFLSHNYKLGRFGKEEVKFSFKKPDTVLYSFNKVNDLNTILQIVDPSGKLIYDNPIPVKGVQSFFVADTSASYVFRVKNKSYKLNEVNFDLKTVRTKTKVAIEVKDAPPIDPSKVYDTVPEILIEEVVYLGAKKNIRSDHKKVLTFEFEKDVENAYASYVVAGGRNYAEDINSEVNLITQEPIGDPLVALGMGKINKLPKTARDNLKFEFKGRGVSVKETIDSYDVIHFPKDTYEDQLEITLSNSDEVVGAYIYVKVVAFKKIPQSQ